MIRGGSALGRLFTRPLGLAFRPTASNWTRLSRPFSHSDDEGNDQLEIVDEDNETGRHARSKHVEYQFYSKNIAIVVENPLFPYSQKIVHLGKNHTKLINTKMPNFVTCVIRKESDSDIKPNGAAAEAHIPNSLKGKNVTEEFLPVATYCSVQYDKQLPHKITLKGIHKVNVGGVHQYPLKSDDDTSSSNFHGLMQEISQHEPREEELSPAKPREENKAMETFLKQSIQAMKEKGQGHKLSDDLKLHIADIEKIPKEKIILTIEERIMVENMIEISKKIMTANNMNFLQEPPLNPNDIELYLDFYAGFLVRSNFIQHEDILPAFLEKSTQKRLKIMHELMNKYYIMTINMKDVSTQTTKNIYQRQSKEFFNEALKIVTRIAEGGKKIQKLVEKLNAAMAAKSPPKHVQELFSEHMKRLESTTQESTETNTLKSYLEWMVSIPYGVRSEDNLDIANVRKQLDSDHYGLDDVKDRILEFVAVGKMRNTVKEKILLLHGPPGVGKTSLAESVAKALGRQYERISLGGESDSSVLKGHRRTYLGAYPGKIVTALKKCGKENCVIILDEVDKLGKSTHHGDPQSNLLEILDPSQNKSFVDNYLDYPIDLSNVLFICTANSLSPITAPLLDRMDVISLSSYTSVEKKSIFHKHLLPKAIRDAGLTDLDSFEIPDNVVEVLINDYCREPGVRSLERHAKMIADKVAYKIVMATDKDPQAKHEKIVITVDNLKNFVGNPIFEKEHIYSKFPPGVAVGLAYTQMGGSILFLEAKKGSFTKETNAPGIRCTGTLGDVMSESMKIAYTFARNFLNSRGSHFLEKNDVHIHAPEGATPKDGPSAGITITTSLVSLALNTPVKSNVGMTGELSLNGKIMKIGGVKEKTLAGKREGLTELIFPKENEEDVKDLKDYIREGVKFHFVSTYEEAMPILFPEVK